MDYDCRQITTEEEMKMLTQLAVNVYIDQPFFSKLAPSRQKRRVKLTDILYRNFIICKTFGSIYGHFDGNRLVSFICWVDYNLMRNEAPVSLCKLFPHSMMDYSRAEDGIKGLEYQIINNKLSDFKHSMFLVYWKSHGDLTLSGTRDLTLSGKINLTL